MFCLLTYVGTAWVSASPAASPQIGETTEMLDFFKPKSNPPQPQSAAIFTSLLHVKMAETLAFAPKMQSHAYLSYNGFCYR
jgi:hypothetical protein